MSELKAHYINTRSDNECYCYFKSEADKVIADLEESHKKEVEQLLIEIAELKAQKAQAEDDRAYWEFKAHRERHNKYKRCLTMAMWCKSKSEIYNEFAADASEYMPSYEARFRSKAVLYQKWAMRWMELAKRFNDNEAK